MSLFVSSINSGSNGNCYYVGTNTDALLVDVGISCREVERRMKRLSLDMHKVRAIFISHEHSDHIQGVRVLQKKYNIPVYISQRTFFHSGLDLIPELVHFFSADDQIQLNDMSVTCFSKIHDAADPYSFVISHQGTQVGVMTDLGRVCQNVIRHFSVCHAVFLEANYDEEMLENGPYPWMLKNRIRGGKGHLSNREALDLFTKHKPAFMSHLFLSHLSADNNCPETVHTLFETHAEQVQLCVAPRHEETAVYAISCNGQTQFMTSEKQLSLF